MVAQQRDGAVLVQQERGRRQHGILEPRHDLYARQVAFVNGAVERLPGERLLVDASVRAPVEQAAVALELGDGPGRAVDQRPRKFLVVEKPTAAYGVGEVHLDGVTLAEHGVVAALHHTGAAALPKQALGRHTHPEPRVARQHVQRGHQAGAAAADNQHVQVQLVVHRPKLQPFAAHANIVSQSVEISPHGDIL